MNSSAIPMETPFFMTHHSPVGAWSSLTFGLPGEGVGIETEALSYNYSGDLLVACSHGPEQTVTLPFFASRGGDDYEGAMAGNRAPGAFRSWRTTPSDAMKRRLTPAIDEYQAESIRLRVISPRIECSDPADPGFNPLAILPALLIELEIDNRTETNAATGFLGLAYRGSGRIRPLDWSDQFLAGIGFQERWALAALATEDVFTIRAGSVGPHVENGHRIVHPGGNEGGIGFRVPPGERRVLTAIFGFFRPGNGAVQGRSASYAYTTWYSTVEKVCHAGLAAAREIRKAAEDFDAKFQPAEGRPSLRELLAQASQGYYANSSLVIDDKQHFHWSVCEGQFAWRNTLDLAVDHLPFELTLHPWIARNVIDGFIDTYSYRDTLRFDDEKDACHPGGLSFTHDQGNYTCYSPPGQSGYEQPDRVGLYSFMTTEELLNGVYCASAVALACGGEEWRERRLPVAVDLLESMENREHFEPSLRDGVLMGQSSRVGIGMEITTYDALDHSLQNSMGCTYVVVKTWTAALMLARWFELERDDARELRARALAGRAATTLESNFRHCKRRFPANVLTGGEALVSAILEPLAVPLFCGLDGDLRSYSGLIEALRIHGRNCLSPGACLDRTTGGLRLSSSAKNTWPSKVALVFSVLEWLEGKSIGEIEPDAWAEFVHWLQFSAARTTISDQIDASTRQQIGGAYYPRLVSLQMFFS